MAYIGRDGVYICTFEDWFGWEMHAAGIGVDGCEHALTGCPCGLLLLHLSVHRQCGRSQQIESIVIFC